MVESVIMKDNPIMKFGSSEVFCDKDCFFESFSRFFDDFDFFAISFLEYFGSSLNFIDICNLDFLIFLMNEILRPEVYFEFLMNRNDRTDCNFFSFNIYEMNTFECSVLRMQFFCESPYFHEMKEDFSSITIRSDSTFLGQKKEGEVNENILKCQHRNEKESEILESEVCFFRRVLRLSGGSSFASRGTFFRMISDNCIEIDDSVEVIERNDLKGLK
jgi:hypothetical protein